MIQINYNIGKEQTEFTQFLFTNASLAETCEKLLGNLDTLREDFGCFRSRERDEQLIGIIRRLDDVIVEYESVSDSFLKTVQAISANKELDGAIVLLLMRIYSEISRDRTVILEGRGTDLELAGLSCIEPLNTGGSRPPESISTY